MQEEIKHHKTYRYEILNPESKSRKILYVLHGYGQLSRFFIRKFQSIKDDFLIVAPEGMHRFYLEGSSGRVGASWMTKEAREHDISDNIEWLNELHRSLVNERKIEKYHVLGFSQGGATAARWHRLSNIKFDSLVLWACVFPPDLELSVPLNDKLGDFHFTIGEEDEFYDTSQQLKLLDFYRNNGYSCHHYCGSHDVHNETLLNIYRQIEQGKR
jgi:predicted esterase